jgi:enoyl-CoA hydratase/carnithine racemase
MIGIPLTTQKKDLSSVRYESQYDPATAPSNLEYVLYEKKDHVAYVTINRPEVRNALHSYAYAELRSCWTDMGRDPNIYVGVLTGAGQAFCAGRDVKFGAKQQAEGKLVPHEDPNHPLYHWGGGGRPSDVELNKPLIAAVNGFAVGVGLHLFLECQLRVMEEDAWLGDQHTNVGRVGSPHQIYAALPQATAAYLTLCNGRLSAQECLELGIINRIAAKGELIKEAEGLADMVCLNAPLAVQAAVKLYRLSSAPPAALEAYARALDKEIGETEDGVEGSRAFTEKRRPVWKVR